VIGLAGARLYYMAEHPRRPRGLMKMTSGMCIQGFVLAAVGTVIVGALLVGLPMGRLLDVTAPGLLFGMAIGRIGCFFGGCCAGRPTASRWGLWSSDRRMGVRRIPTQLFESAMALLIGVVALLAMIAATPDPGGLVFAAGAAAYTFARQLLFPLRDLPRNTAYGRALTMAASGLVLVAAIATAVLA
jgi:phosphatidylglycerol:prolipoprotein diacylglycerol transferase